MFDLEHSYHVGPPYKNSSTSEYGALGYKLYKVKTTKRQPYIIRVEEFANDLYFIKFYPKKYQDSDKKYTIRLGNVNEFTRLVSTCMKIAGNILKREPDSSFGFHGQWDEKDIIVDINELTDKPYSTSQRYNIYKGAILRKIDPDKFKFHYEESINIMAIFPNHIYENEKIMGKIKNSMKHIFEKRLNALRVPTKSEYESKAYD